MKWSREAIFGASVLLSCCVLQAQREVQPRELAMSQEQVDTMLEKLYTQLTGFTVLTLQETHQIVDAGGAPTYGEMKSAGVQILLDDLNLTTKDVFYDLGSGAGRMVVYVYLASKVKKAVGIELAVSRYEASEQALARLKSQQLLARKRSLEFRHENILDADLKDATVIYTASLCFSRYFMRALSTKLSKLKPGLRFLTLQKIPRPAKYGFVFIKTYMIPMTWSEEGASDCVFLYELRKRTKRKHR